MEKAFSLDQREAAAFAALVREQEQACAQFGALTIQRKAAKQALLAAQERQRSFIVNTVLHRGIDQFNGARIVDNNLICSLPDPPAELPPAPPSDKHVNGAPQIIDAN